MMAQVRIDFQGRREVETFSWARIQAMRDSVQLALRIGRQVRPLGQVLTQQPIRVLVGATLPGAVRIGKEDLDPEALGQSLVLGHLFPPIIGQRFAQHRGHVPEFLGEALSGTRRIRPLHPSYPKIHDEKGHTMLVKEFQQPQKFETTLREIVSAVLDRGEDPKPLIRALVESIRLEGTTNAAQEPLSNCTFFKNW
jgi:hypothetical protein